LWICWAAAFFSVSLSAAGKTEGQRQHARDCLDQFLRQTHWQPRATAIIAGALLYRTYGFWLRLMMKWIAWREGGDTDTSKDYEYTDWNQVRQFTEEFLRQSLGSGIADQPHQSFVKKFDDDSVHTRFDVSSADPDGVVRHV